MTFRAGSMGWLAAVTALALLPGNLHAGRPSRPVPHRVATIDTDRRIDVNNLNMFVVNNGAFGYDLGGNYNGGLFYPNHTANTGIYAAGLWIGGKVRDSIMLAVAEYDQEYRPGRILPGGTSVDPPGDPLLVVYKVSAWRGAASDTEHVVNPNANFDRGEDPLVHHSWSEYIAGAKPYGAPTRMWRLPDTSTPAPGDSVDVEGPAVLGDLMLWCVYNDASAAAHTNEAGSTPPLGIQIEQSTFAFDRLGPLGNTIFVKYRITNAGLNTIDSLFLSQWADADLGQFTDDVVGCDTLPDLNGKPRSLGFIYNGTNRDDIYGDIPPALGIDFLQGPIVAGDTLGLTSFAKYINGTDPLAAIETWNYMNGRNGDGSPIVDPFGNVTPFMVAGDPFGVPSRNWVDSNPADRRFFMTSGPFTMVPGAVQEVVVAIMVGQCGDRLRSLRHLKFVDDVAQEAYNLGFDVARIPPPPPAPLVSASVGHGTVRLSWDRAAESAPLPPGYRFEGYNIYQGATIAGPWRLVAVYDSVNGLRDVYDKTFDENACEPLLLAPVARGGDNGLSDFHFTVQDVVRGTSIKDATDYYYAVTSYAVNETAPANRVLESSLEAVQVTPQRSAATVQAAAVRPVPNPYYARSTYEQNQFNRRIRFINCPTRTTIRIFNLAGQLVRTLQKDDGGSSVIEWDTQTENGLPVGSGVYLFHVESSAGQSKGRMIVFMERERLNNF